MTDHSKSGNPASLNVKTDLSDENEVSLSSSDVTLEEVEEVIWPSLPSSSLLLLK